MSVTGIIAKILFDKKPLYKYHGKLITLGRQNLEYSENEFRKFFKDYDFNKINASEDFFRLLGFKSCDSIDISSKDGATIIHDLNQPTTDALKCKFDFVMDFGTMEHCFDVASVIKNICNMLKNDGTVIHFIPTQGYANHGFYNIQPTFFFSFYKANHFIDLECFLVEYINKENRNKARVIEIKDNYNNMDYHTTNNCNVLFKAKKTSDKPLKIPIQEFYYQIFKEKAKVNNAMIEDALYQKIVGNIPENNHKEIIKGSYIIDLSI